MTTELVRYFHDNDGPSGRHAHAGREYAGHAQRERAASSESRDDRRGDRRPPRVPAPDEIFQQLMALNQLVLLNLISPGQANVIQRNLKILLDAGRNEGRSGDQRSLEAKLVEFCREDPGLLNRLAPILSDEWIEKILREVAGGGEDGSL